MDRCRCGSPAESKSFWEVLSVILRRQTTTSVESQSDDTRWNTERRWVNDRHSARLGVCFVYGWRRNVALFSRGVITDWINFQFIPDKSLWMFFLRLIRGNFAENVMFPWRRRSAMDAADGVNLLWKAIMHWEGCRFVVSQAHWVLHDFLVKYGINAPVAWENER